MHLTRTRMKKLGNGDRYQIELGEARVLLCTYQVLKEKVLTEKRIKYLEKIYGVGSVARIKIYMTKLQNGELE